jgi:hypothetical protein
MRKGRTLQPDPTPTGLTSQSRCHTPLTRQNVVGPVFAQCRRRASNTERRAACLQAAIGTSRSTRLHHLRSSTKDRCQLGGHWPPRTPSPASPPSAARVGAVVHPMQDVTQPWQPTAESGFIRVKIRVKAASRPPAAVSKWWSGCSPDSAARVSRWDRSVIMRILRHADQAVTMEIYANASSAATQEALRRLGETLH